MSQAQEKQKKKEEGMERTALRKEERAKVFVAPKEPTKIKRKSSGDGDGEIDVEKLKKKLKIKKRSSKAQPATAFILGAEPEAKKKSKKEKKSKKSKKELL